ncbi:MAG: hypothetical protein ACYDH9_12480 [Limisphaerales bacterium]
MRTKTLLLAAVLSAAGVASSLAQVYSVNVVGYIQLSVPAGFSIIANQLSNGGNTLNSVLTTGPGDGDGIFKFNPTTGGYDSSTFLGGSWIPDLSFAPGEGGFISVGSAKTITLVGSIDAGSHAVSVPKGFSIVSSFLPTSGTLASMNFPAADGDQVFYFNTTTKSYDSSTSLGGSWIPDTTVAVGQAFFSAKGAASTWTRTFSVQ